MENALDSKLESVAFHLRYHEGEDVHTDGPTDDFVRTKISWMHR